MRKNWLNRLIVSYLPIFIFINSILIFIFFLVLSDQAKNQAVNANRAAAEQVMQSIDYSLESIHEMVMKELRTNENMRFFFNDNTSPNPLNDAKVSNLLNSMVSSNRLIHTVYLMRDSDGTVLSNKMMTNIDTFGDKPFAVQAFNDKKANAWTGIREFRANADQEKPVSVVSLVRRFPILTGESGIIVINLEAAALQNMIDGMTNAPSTFMDLHDRSGLIFFDKKSQFSSIAGEESDSRPNEVLSVVSSDMTGWELRSGYKNLKLLNAANLVYNVWAWLGLVAILFGAAAVIYLSRKNYKPVELILQRLRTSPLRQNEPVYGKRIDEFNLIETAIDDLIEQSASYKRQHNEDLLFRRHYFFEELMEGARPVGASEWTEQMTRFGLRTCNGGMLVAIMEIDRYAAFVSEYSHRDQHLLKYALAAVMKEVAEKDAVCEWSEWMSGRRLVALLQFAEDASDPGALMKDICERIREWIKTNLGFTVTFGIGRSVRDQSELSLSYEEAQQALQYKPVLGNDTVITSAEATQQPQGELYMLLQTVRELSQSFRLNEKQWKEAFSRFFGGLRDGGLTRDDIGNLLNYLNFHLQKEMLELPAEFQHIWRDFAQAQLADCMNLFELLEDIKSDYYAILSNVSDRFSVIRQHRHNHVMIQEIRVYLEKNYANPDLSLDHISRHFNLNPKYFSRLFKDEFGEKFTDFLAKIRVQEAKRMLLETDEPVQSISVKAGYLHTLSFIRMFKKITGVTPGFFRSEHQSPKGEN